MPFDGAGFTVLERFDAVIALLADERRWCKGSLFTAEGRMCLAGAIRSARCGPAVRPLVLDAAREVTGRRFWTIESFNDHGSTTHAVLLEVMRRTRRNMAGNGSTIAPRRPSLSERCRSLWQGLPLTIRPTPSRRPGQPETSGG
jgi:hypothetical protein